MPPLRWGDSAGGPVLMVGKHDRGDRGSDVDGPFFPSVNGRVDANDVIVVGRNRSTDAPGVLFLDGVGKTFTAAEEVAIFTTADTRLLCLKAKVSGTTLDTAYEFVQQAYVPLIQTSGTGVAEGYLYYPLAWVTVVSDGSYYTVSAIDWPCTDWLLSAAATEYPFRATCMGAVVVVGANRSASRPDVGYVGPYKTEFTASETLIPTMSASGWVYYDVEPVRGSSASAWGLEWRWTLKSATTLPDYGKNEWGWEDVTNRYVVPVGYATLAAQPIGVGLPVVWRWVQTLRSTPTLPGRSGNLMYQTAGPNYLCFRYLSAAGGATMRIATTLPAHDTDYIVWFRYDPTSLALQGPSDPPPGAGYWLVGRVRKDIKGGLVYLQDFSRPLQAALL
jgi:hypothetical protein